MLFFNSSYTTISVFLIPQRFYDKVNLSICPDEL